MFKSLKMKLMLILFVLIVLPLTTLGVISLVKFTDSTETEVKAKLDDLTSLTARIVTGEIDKANVIGSILSENGMVADFLAGDETKKQLVYDYISAQQKKNSNIIEMIAITDAKAQSKMSHADINQSLDLSSREYIQNALKGTPSQTDVIVSKASNKPVIAIAYPVYKDGKIVGAMITTVLYENISKNVAAIKVFDAGYAYMFNKDGMFLYHPNKEFPFKKTIQDLNVPETLPMIEDVANGKSGEVYYTYEGIEKYVKYVSVNGMGIAITANYNDYMSTALAIQKLMIMIMVAAAIIALVIGYWFTNGNIIRPLNHLAHEMEKAGDGDLTVQAHITTGDEIQQIGESFNLMIEHQKAIVAKVKVDAIEIAQSSDDIAHSTTEVSGSSEMISKSIQVVADNSVNQAKSVIETSETLLQLASLIQLAKARALTAESNVKNSLKSAVDGRKSVDITLSAIEDIDKASKETNTMLKSLEELSIRVKGIIDTINGIAGQTNLLALNASIEAARAGEHGRGFAVVAEEVRKLAEQTSSEASGITNVVGEMVDNIQKAVTSMNSGYRSVQEGVSKAKSTDEAFVTIAKSVEEIYKDISKIVEVTDNEVASSEKIVNLINDVATLSENNSANSQEVAASVEEQTALLQTIAAGSEELTAMANELKELVEKFKVEV